jgi:hypothetical protein
MAATFLELATAKSLNVARPGIPTAGGHHGRGREQRTGRQLSQGTSRKFSLGSLFLAFFIFCLWYRILFSCLFAELRVRIRRYFFP